LFFIVYWSWSEQIAERSSTDRLDSRALVAMINENPGKCSAMIIHQALVPSHWTRAGMINRDYFHAGIELLMSDASSLFLASRLGRF
jgi:hypothetical protein